MKSADLIGHIKFLPWRQLNGCSVTTAFLSLQRVWLVRLSVIPHKCTSLELATYMQCKSELQSSLHFGAITTQSSGVARSQTTPGHCTRFFFVVVVVGQEGGGGVGACFPSKFLYLRGSYSDCS